MNDTETAITWWFSFRDTVTDEEIARVCGVGDDGELFCKGQHFARLCS